MKLMRQLPPSRTYEQVLNHYMVEKSIAERLKSASREERRAIYSTMYDELFRRVPDHPRLTRSQDEEQRFKKKNAAKLALVQDLINPSSVFVEFAPGNCVFAMEVAKRVRTVHAIDISDQRPTGYKNPPNFNLIIYDGYHLTGIEEGTADVVFSDQFVEHLHPEDVCLHFELALKLLKPGGKYLFVTPHAYNGPHDISYFFSDKPEGFHLKEWAYTEIKPLLTRIGYSKVQPVWWARGIRLNLPFGCFAAVERLLERMPRNARHDLANYLLPSICVAAIK